MKADLMDKLQQLLASHHGKGLWSYLVYIVIFISMLAYVVLKPLLNFLTLNKLKLK